MGVDDDVAKYSLPSRRREPCALPILTNDERIGTILAEKYRLIRVLGEGGMGVVFEGVHELTQRPVAVKLLHAHLSNHGTMVQRSLREARAAAALRHRNVVDVLDMGREPGGQVYLVLEFLTGEPFSDRLRRCGPLSADEATRLILPIMSALHAAHLRGIVHRDVKPENVFIAVDPESGEEVPKLLDFGIAKIDGGARATSTGEAIGTPAYMAPEQATNAAVVDARADIWSVGVLWFEALTGHLPYKADNVMQALAMLLTTDPMRLSEVAPSVPAPLAAAVERAMMRDREARWPSLDHFTQAVLGRSPESIARIVRVPEPTGESSRASREIVDPLSTTMTPSVLPGAQTSAQSSRRVLMIASAVSVLCLVLAVIGGLLQRSAPEDTSLPMRIRRLEPTRPVTPVTAIPSAAEVQTGGASDAGVSPAPTAPGNSPRAHSEPRRVPRVVRAAPSAVPAEAPSVPNESSGQARPRVMNW